MALREHIEHTLLKPDAQVRDVEALCAEAKAYGLLGVCVNPCYVEMASRLLAGTDVKVVTVVGFPLGQNESSVKAREARRAAGTSWPGARRSRRPGRRKRAKKKPFEKGQMRGCLTVRLIYHVCIQNASPETRSPAGRSPVRQVPSPRGLTGNPCPGKSCRRIRRPSRRGTSSHGGKECGAKRPKRRCPCSCPGPPFPGWGCHRPAQ